VLEVLVHACLDAVRRDASDAVLLGCTCMSPVSSSLAERVDIPVIDASAAGLRAAHLAALSGRPASASPGSRRAGWSVRLTDAWLAAGEEVPTSPDECIVCSLTWPGSRA
jgi:allantoin racemase